MRGKNIVFYVTRQYMKKNRCRTATTFAGIVLMVLLMTCVFIGRDTGVKYLEALASQKNGRYHASVYDISETEYQEILRLPYVKQTAASAGLGSTVFELSANEERPYLNIKGYTKNCYEWMNISLAEGRLPENESEIAVSRSAVEDGSSMKLGDRIDAEFFERSITGIGRDGGTTYFPFSGLSIQSGDTMDVPENFPYYGENDSFQENHRYTGEQKQYEIVGIIEPPAYESGVAAGYTALTTLTTEQVLGRDSFNLSVIFDQELLPDTYFQDWEKMFPDCEVETNDLLLAFSADSSDTTINLVVRYMTVLFTLLIMAVSVVLIYNVFHMSFRERSRYLGMLCSVGATGRQKRSSIYYEACYLLLLGLPLGIFLGIGVVWIAMTAFRPLLVQFMNIGYGAETLAVQVQISIKNLAAVSALSILTVLLSAYLPARRIGRIGPIESIRGNTERKSRTYRTSRRAIGLLGAQGLLAWNTLNRRSQKIRSVARAAAVFLVLLAVTAFGSESLHQVMEKKLQSGGLRMNPESCDYILQAYGSALGGAYEALKEEIVRDPGVESVQEWYLAMFIGNVEAGVYSEEYWEASYDIFNSYHHGTLSRETFEKQWKNPTPAVNMISVDGDIFGEMAKACGIDPDTLEENSVLVLNEGEFSTDNVGVMGMEPDRYRYYHVDNMTSLHPGDELPVQFYSDQKGEYVTRKLSIVGYAKTAQLEKYLSGAGDYYLWIITGPSVGRDVMELTKDAEGAPYMTPELHIRLNGKETDLIQRLSQLSDLQEGAFYLTESGYIQSIEHAVVALADGLLLSFVILSSLICLLNLFNSVRGWMAGSIREYAVLRSVGMTKGQMRQMLLLQCGGIILRAVLLALLGSGLLIAVIYNGMTVIFGNLVLQFPLLLFVLAVLLVGIVLAVFSFWSLKKELEQSDITVIK
ncbi:MAG: FtsX-like permease family protein [Lachnospiraceae bacterium]